MGDEFRKPEQQKREMARLNVDFAGSYKLKGATDWLQCEIIDIGTGGIQLRGKFSFYEGDVVDSKFFIEDKVILCQIEITNISGRKAGGKYTAIEEKDLDVIQNYIHKTIMG